MPRTLTAEGLTKILEQAGLVYRQGDGVFNAMNESVDLTDWVVDAVPAINDFFNSDEDAHA